MKTASILKKFVIFMSLLGSLFISGTALAECPNGVIEISEWNHFLDGTVSDINGCLIRVSDPAAVQGDEKIGNVTAKPNTPIPDTPSGWTPPVPPAVQPTPPSTTTPTYMWVYGPYSGATYQEVCATVASVNSTTPTGQTVHNANLVSCHNASGLTVNISRVPSCPAGYSSSGSNCNLTNSSAVMKPSDQKCTIIRTGNTFGGDPMDPDCGAGFNAANKITVSGDTVSKLGNPSFSIKANSDNSTTITTTTINNTNNTTTVSTGSFGADGIQTGRKTEIFNGIGSQQSVTPLPPGSTSGPTDMTATNAKLGEISNKLDVEGAIGSGTYPEGPESFYESEYPDGIQGVWDAFKSNLDQTAFAQAINSFVPDWNGGTCPSWIINVNIGPGMNFGQSDIAPPCYIWPVLKIIFIITALFFARSLIFGG